MSTPSAPTRSDTSSADSPAERRSSETPARRDDAVARDQLPEEPSAGRDDECSESSPAGPSDRAVDADLLIDIPQLTVEELALELDATLMLNHVKLDAKGLDLGLFLKANFDSLRALTQQGFERTGREGGAPAESTPGADVKGVRTGLRELLGATRDAYRDLSDQDVQRQLRDVHESAREAHDRVTTADEPADKSRGDDDDGRESGRDRNGHAGRPRAVGDRLRHAAGQGAKAAGLTAAGLAGGALLESRSKPSRKLPIPRRRNRVQAVRDEISRLLP